MAWFKKRSDPISERGQALNDEIARLESEIQTLARQLEQRPEGPRLRAPAVPGGNAPAPASLEPAPAPRLPTAGTETQAPGAARDPIFEEVDVERLARAEGASPAPEHFNDQGVRKYDLPALMRRVRDRFRGPTASNPKLVSYLAAGGIQGLRPLRYEKRVARNRFIVLVAGLLLVLLGLVLVFVRNTF